jgi:hypothetical protein
MDCVHSETKEKIKKQTLFINSKKKKKKKKWTFSLAHSFQQQKSLFKDKSFLLFDLGGKHQFRTESQILGS